MDNKQNKKIFNLDNYSGIYPKDFIPQLISNIEKIFMRLDKESIERKAVDKYIELLNYYNLVANSESPLIQYGIQFCTDLKSNLQSYAKERYQNYHINTNFKGRIKSPTSASDKFKKNIVDAIHTGKNLDDITIKDLFAFRITVTVRDSIGNVLDDNIAIPVTYDLVEQALKYAANYEFVKINPSKPRSEKNAPIIHDIVLPKERPSYIIEMENQKYLKDYMMYPKRDTNYQSIHSKLEINLPNINHPLLLEMQIRTHDMNEHAEKGPASHIFYKSTQGINFHRVPQIFKERKDGSLGFISMDEAFQDFYNIPTSDIYPTANLEEVQEILRNSQSPFHYEIESKTQNNSEINENSNQELNKTAIQIQKKPTELDDDTIR